MVLGDVIVAIVSCLEHGDKRVKTSSEHGIRRQAMPDTVHRQRESRIHLWRIRLSSTIAEKLRRIQRASHKLEVAIATSPNLPNVCRCRPKGRPPLDHSPEEFAMFVGECNVRLRHQLFPAPSERLGDHGTRQFTEVCEHYNVEEEEAAGYRPALFQCLLRSFLALRDIFDACAGAVVIVIELMESAKIATEG